MKYLQKKGQEKFEETHSREEFISKFVKSRKTEETGKSTEEKPKKGENPGFWFIEE